MSDLQTRLPPPAVSWPGRTTLGSVRSNPTAAWRHVDLVLVGAVFALSALGALMVFSATRGVDPSSPSTTFLGRQIVFILLGGGLAVLTAGLDYRRFGDYSLAAYGFIVLALVLVLSPMGTESKGAQRSFELATFQFQPAEFAKIIVVIVLAALITQFQGDLDLRRLAVLMAVAGLPFVLIMMQPDLGTGLVFIGIAMGMLLVGGARARHIVVITLFGIVGVIGVLNSDVLADYQKDRLTTFLNQDQNLRGETYNLNQSKIAIGAGGLAGKGLFEGTQTRLGIVPEQHTDFIFTALGEELGFIGAATALLLYSIIAWRIWRTAQLARDLLGSLICVGVLSMLAFQIFQNVGMTMGIMPITGIPLPLMSYGGSQTLVSFAAMGLILNVHMRRFA